MGRARASLSELVRVFKMIPSGCKPLNKGHIGIMSIVPCREVVLILEIMTTSVQRRTKIHLS